MKKNIMDVIILLNQLVKEYGSDFDVYIGTEEGTQGESVGVITIPLINEE